MFASQDKWAFVDSPLEPLFAALRPTGLGREKAMACLKDQKLADQITQIGKTATEVVKLQGTPTFVIDGKVYGGELSMDDFDAILKPLIRSVTTESQKFRRFANDLDLLICDWVNGERRRRWRSERDRAMPAKRVLRPMSRVSSKFSVTRIG